MNPALDWLRQVARDRPSIVHARIRRSGVGNMLLIWARAAVFARLNGLPLVATGWAAPRIGPWLRGEARKRVYLHYFRPAWPPDWGRAVLLARLGRAIVEPSVAPASDDEAARGVVYVFDQLPRERHYFDDIAPHREIVRAQIEGVLSGYCRRQLDAAVAPTVGIHVRRGDFRPLRPGETLAQTFARTPIEFFCRALESVRAMAGGPLPAMVFSDGRDDELAPLLAMPGVVRNPPAADVVELLTLGRSRVIVGSAHSTFSQLAGFLSDAPLILPPAESLGSIRPPTVRERLFEGGVGMDAASWPPLLVENLRSLARGQGS